MRRRNKIMTRSERRTTQRVVPHQFPPQLSDNHRKFNPLAERGGQFYTDQSDLMAQAFQSRPLSKGHQQFDNAIMTTGRDDDA
jgi:hypothetical protein